MATYTTQKSQTYSTVVGQGGSRNLVTDGCTITLTSAMTDNANDEIELLWVPKGAVVVSVELRCADIDSSTGIIWDVGDDGDEDRLIAATTVGQTAATTTTLAAAGFLYKYTAATKIKAYVNTAVSGTFSAGTLYFRITYFVDENFSATNAVVS